MKVIDQVVDRSCKYFGQRENRKKIRDTIEGILTVIDQALSIDVAFVKATAAETK